MHLRGPYCSPFRPGQPPPYLSPKGSLGGKDKFEVRGRPVTSDQWQVAKPVATLRWVEARSIPSIMQITLGASTDRGPVVADLRNRFYT